MSIFDCSNEASNVKRKRKAAPRTKQPSHKSATVIDSIPATENQRPMNKWQMNRLSDVVGSADANIISNDKINANAPLVINSVPKEPFCYADDIPSPTYEPVIQNTTTPNSKNVHLSRDFIDLHSVFGIDVMVKNVIPELLLNGDEEAAVPIKNILMHSTPLTIANTAKHSIEMQNVFENRNIPVMASTPTTIIGKTRGQQKARTKQPNTIKTVPLPVVGSHIRHCRYCLKRKCSVNRVLTHERSCPSNPQSLVLLIMRGMRRIDTRNFICLFCDAKFENIERGERHTKSKHAAYMVNNGMLSDCQQINNVGLKEIFMRELQNANANSGCFRAFSTLSALLIGTTQTMTNLKKDHTSLLRQLVHVHKFFDKEFAHADEFEALRTQVDTNTVNIKKLQKKVDINAKKQGKTNAITKKNLTNLQTRVEHLEVTTAV